MSALDLPETEARDLDLDRDADQYGFGSGGKKRKIPSFFQPAGKLEQDADTFSTANDQASDLHGEEEGPKSTLSVAQIPRFRSPASPAFRLCAFRRALFLRRKAALITLYLDAQSALVGGAAKVPAALKVAIPNVSTFEQLIPSLEGVGVGDWAPDKSGWRNNWEEARDAGRFSGLAKWKTKFESRRRARLGRKPIKRGGWAPEGSFEFEMECKASAAARLRTRDQASLQKLTGELRMVVMSHTKSTSSGPYTKIDPDMRQPEKTKRKIDSKGADAEKATLIEVPPPTIEAEKLGGPIRKIVSKDSSDTSGKKKTKKKKRSVLANQSNPHHVDNYRSSRPSVLSISPNEPYPHHVSLLFPPPMSLLAARPLRKTAPLPGQSADSQPVRAGEDDFICTFCEIELFFGTEVMRRRAVRRIRVEMKRKDRVRSKAKGVADGTSKLKDPEDEEDYDDDDDDENEDGCAGDAAGRCTCGRAIDNDAQQVIKKPPDKNPPTATESVGSCTASG